MGSLGSVNDYEVGQLCRIVCTVNLQYLKELFKKIWAFSIGLDAKNNAGLSYLDIWMRCYFKGDIRNLHLLVAIPMRERHTGISSQCPRSEFETPADWDYLDIWMRCYLQGDIQNLHLLAIPMQERQCPRSKLETPAD